MHTARFVQVWHLRWAERLREAWRIWVCPWVLLHVYTAVFLAFFATVDTLIDGNDKAAYFLENMLVFTLYGATLATLYFIMGQYEKVRQVKVRRRTRMFWGLFAGVYALYVLLNVCELAGEMRRAGAH